MLGVPAAYFHGKTLYSTRSGATCPSAIMSPLALAGREHVVLVDVRVDLPER
jgi:hypothetical protein